MIHLTDGQTDNILDFVTSKNIIADTHRQSLKDSLETYEMRVLGDKSYVEHLGKHNRVVIPAEDDGYKEFVIVEAEKYRDSEGLKVEVFASASYLLLKKSRIIDPIKLESQSPSSAASFATRDTEWVPGIIEGEGSRTINVEKHTNPFSLLKTIAKEFGLELRFRTETDGRRITGRYVDLLERVGQWRGREVEFEKDLIGISRKEKTDDIYTALRGVGPKGKDGEQMEVYVTDTDALHRWGRVNPVTGELQHLVDLYKPQSTRSDMTLKELRQYTQTELNKRVNAVVEYESTIADLENVPGMEGKKIRFGDTIKIKDTKFNPPLYLEARVHTQERSIVDKSKKKVELGDYIEYTEEEVKAVWQELQQEIQKKVDLYEMLDYTYDKSTIDSKDEFILGDGKEYSRNVSKDAEDSAKNHADEVAREAEKSSKEYAKDQAQQAEQSALEKAVAKSVYEETISEIASELEGKASNSVVDELKDEVADKVDAEWVDGKLQGKADSSALDGLKDDIATKVDGDWVDGKLASKADKDSTYSKTEVDNALDSKVSSSEYKTDKDGYVERFESNETSIKQNKDEIASKASSEEYDSLSGKVESHDTAIKQNATDIESKASQSSVDAVSGDVEQAKSDIKQNAEAIESKVSKTEYNEDQDGIIDRLSTAESSITQTAEDVKSKVSQTEYDSDIKGEDGLKKKMTSAQTEITQNAKAIEQRATKKSVDDLTGEVSDLGSTVTQQAGKIASKVEQSAFDSKTSELGSQISKVEQTASGIKQEVSDVKADVKDLGDDVSGMGDTLSSHKTSIDQNAKDIGLRATKSEVNAVKGTAEDAKAGVKVNAEEIGLRAKKTEVDAVTGRVSTAESKITQNAKQIDLRVKEDGVISAINLSKESARIKAKNIDLVGAVTVLSDITGKLGSISAGDITGVSIKGSIFEQKGSAGSVTLDDDGLTTYDANGNPRIAISTSNDSFQGFSPSMISFDSSNPETNFAVASNAHGLGDGFLGFINDSKSHRSMTVRNWGGTITLDAGTVELYSDDYVNVPKGGLKLVETGANQGLSLGPGRTDHVLVAHTTGYQFMMYPQRFKGENILTIRSHNNHDSYQDDFWIDLSSVPYFRGLYNNTSSNSSNARVSYNLSGGKTWGSVYRVVSAKKYKTDIEKADIDPYKILQLDPKSWVDTHELEENGGEKRGLERHFGLIADDVEEVGLPQYVDYMEGEVEGLAYERLWTLLIPIVKKQQQDIEELKKKLSEKGSESL